MHEREDAFDTCFRYETRLAEVGPHANRTVCALIGRDRSITLWAGGRRYQGEALLVRPGVEHSLVFGEQETTILYLDHARWSAGAPEAARRLTDSERDLAELCAPGVSDASAAFAAAIGPPPRAFGSLARVMREIAADPMKRMNQETLAQHLGCERSNALKRFRALTGLTFRGYKQWRAVSAATRDLLRGAGVRTAALDAGFADVAHFCRVFRQLCGVSPGRAGAATRLAAP